MPHEGCPHVAAGNADPLYIFCLLRFFANWVIFRNLFREALYLLFSVALDPDGETVKHTPKSLALFSTLKNTPFLALNSLIKIALLAFEQTIVAFGDNFNLTSFIFAAKVKVQATTNLLISPQLLLIA